MSENLLQLSTNTSKNIESAVRKALYDFSMLEGKASVAVALSGGKDSLTLLQMLKKISGKGFPDLNLIAIHVNGEFSCGANVQIPFLQSFCEKLNIPLIVKISHQKLETLECYSCSRERRKLLFETAKDEKIDLIAFGHHRDDQVQTLLLNLFHKAEFATLLPKLEMVHYGVTIIRPLIYLTEQQIITYAKQQEFFRITCQCPVGQNSKRRKTEDLLKRIEHDFPNVRSNLFQAALMFGSEKAKNP